MTWPTVPLSEVAEVRLGRQRAPKNHRGDSMRPYIRAANVTWRGLSLTDVKTMNFTETEMATYRMEPGDIVLSEASGSPKEVGKPSLWAGEIADCAFQNTLIRIRPWKHEPKFLLHYFRFQALAGRFVEHARGVGIHHVGRSRLASWPTPLPPLDEQRRIVNLLEDHLSRLDAADHYLWTGSARLERLEDSILASTFEGYRDRSHRELGDLVAPRRRVAYGVLQPGEHQADGVPLIRVGDLHELSQLESASTLKHISPQIDARFPSTRLSGGEVLLSVVGTIGRVAVAPTWLAGSNVARAVAVWPTSDALLPEFAALALRNPHVQLRLVAAAHEVARKTLNLEDVRRIAIPVPDVSEQRQLVTTAKERLESLRRLEGELHAGRAHQQVLRRSLLAAAFSGQLARASAKLDRIEGTVG